MSKGIANFLQIAPVIPVLTIARVEDAVPLARALVAGGLRVLEVTLRTDAAPDAIRRIAEEVGDAIVGAGTVLNARDLERAKSSGACFAVSPGLTEDLAREANALSIPLLPGIATASDIMRGLDLGFAHFKFFPAEASGGAPTLKAFQGPFAQCRFCPTGGITLENAPRYLALGNVVCIGGTWIAPNEFLAGRDWPAVTARAREASHLKKNEPRKETSS